MGTKSLPGQRHLGGVPWVNSALWCGGSPVRNPGGTPIFWPLPFRGDRLETKKGARELGLREDTIITEWYTVLKQNVCCNFSSDLMSMQAPLLVLSRWYNPKSLWSNNCHRWKTGRLGQLYMITKYIIGNKTCISISVPPGSFLGPELVYLFLKNS